jgi:diguanylate cyclase (GGDEF)-like protein
VRTSLKRTRRTGEPVSLLVMDLDHFKDVNDALGHEQGDRLLIEISRRLATVVSEADTVARLGGDEFAVLLTDDADEPAARRVARRIRKALEEPFHLGGITLESSASIGIAVAPDHGVDAETLAQRADVAMYAAKRSGAEVAVYARDLDQSSIRRLALLGELRSAITEDDLRLRYQPCLDLASGIVRSAEALVRWQHPTHGLLPPSEFIELAEVSGLIRPLTRWVIENVLGQIHQWSAEGVELRVAANLSVKDLYDRDLVPWLRDRLDAWGVPASQLKLEITESELMDDPLLALEVLGKLKALGVHTSIDDFGTGYSSLAYLKHLPIDELKIDKSFVGNLVQDANDLVIVRSTIDLAHNLGLAVVAEGVEDGATLDRLAELSCDRAQGFFVSRPLAGSAVVGWLGSQDRARHRLAAHRDARGA